MLLDEIKKLKSNKKEWRKFGLTVGTVFGLLGLLAWWRGKSVYPYLLSLSAALIILGAAAPGILRPVYRVWMALAMVMGFVMTNVLLTLLYFIALTPVGVIARLTGKDFLDQKFHENKESYWQLRKKVQLQKEDYEKQF